MIIVAGTNILARLVMKDDVPQFEAAANLVVAATKIVVPTVVLCELAWVLRSSYKRDPVVIANIIREILAIDKVIAEDDAVLAGLRMLDQGGDFADGVAHYTGSLLAGGPSSFASFDQAAVERLVARGLAAMIPQ
jgi:predicted nucleic-acid-binding protein